MTTEEYLRGPETVAPQELVYGVLRDAASPSPTHQDVAGAIYRRLWQHLADADIGHAWMSPIDVVLDRKAGLIVQPDVIVVMHARRGIVTDRVWGAPDLVVEVLSPQPRIGRLDERLRWFAEYGVRECWLAHHLRGTFDVIAFQDGVGTARTVATSERIASRVLPGFDARPAEFFRRHSA